jgi:hypothetical protein
LQSGAGTLSQYLERQPVSRKPLLMLVGSDKGGPGCRIGLSRSRPRAHDIKLRRNDRP